MLYRDSLTPLVGKHYRNRRLSFSSIKDNDVRPINAKYFLKLEFIQQYVLKLVSVL